MVRHLNFKRYCIPLIVFKQSARNNNQPLPSPFIKKDAEETKEDPEEHQDDQNGKLNTIQIISLLH